MLTYLLRQELTELISIDPVLHYYPLLACYREPHALTTAWKDETGMVLGCVIPCEPPGRLWLLGASEAAVMELLKEIPPDEDVTVPLWTDGVVRQINPGRSITTDALAVCTESSFHATPTPMGLKLRRLDSSDVRQSDTDVWPLMMERVGLFAGEQMLCSCAYQIDGRGGASIESVVVDPEWRSVDLGKAILSATSDLILQRCERIIFAASGANQSVLGVARSVGYRTCYWLRCASADGQSIETPEP